MRVAGGSGGRPASKSLFDRVRELDAYPKTLDEFRVRTSSGAVLSICALFLVFVLFVSEFAALVSSGVEEHLTVASMHGETMRINFDFTFHSMPCSVISVDAADSSGSPIKDVGSHIFKKRLDSSGKQLGYQEKHELGGTLKTTGELLKHKEKATEGQEKKNEGEKAEEQAARDAENVKANNCGSCYGAETEALQCCNTCDDVREAYRKKGWSFMVRDNIVQCSKEGFVDSVAAQKGEGCNIFGYVDVKKASGNFHFAPGNGFAHAHNSVQDLFAYTLKQWNVSHRINELAFGESYPGAKNPLDGVEKILHKGTGMYQYYTNVVPTDFTYSSGKKLKTNQFSVTDHFRPVTIRTARGMPGIFIFYELSPIQVEARQARKSFGSFLTSICAIVGGIFTVMGLLDSAVHSTLKKAGFNSGLLAR